MATQRYISTSFWDDSWIQSLSPMNKLAYMYLLTNPLTNIAGVYKLSNRRMAFDLGLDEEAVCQAFLIFAMAKKAYHHGEYVVIPSWPRHQSFESRRKIAEGILAILNRLPVQVISFLRKVGYQYPLDKVSTTYTYEPNYSDSDSDSDSDLSIEKPPSEAVSPQLPQIASKRPKSSQIVPKRAKAKPPMSADPLYAPIWGTFLMAQPNQKFADYGAAGKAVQRIVQMVRNQATPGQEAALAEKILETFARMIKTGKGDFWSRMAFHPVQLSGQTVYTAVIAEIAKESEPAMSQDDETLALQEELRQARARKNRDELS